MPSRQARSDTGATVKFFILHFLYREAQIFKYLARASDSLRIFLRKIRVFMFLNKLKKTRLPRGRVIWFSSVEYQLWIDRYRDFHDKNINNIYDT